MISNIQPEGYVHDTERRSCYDCRHLKAAVTWWCTDEAAAKWRGTKIPGVHHCPFWKPAPVAQPSAMKVTRRRIGAWIRRVIGVMR